MSVVYVKAPSTPRNDLSAVGLGLLSVVSIFAVLPLLMNIPAPWDKPPIEPAKPISEPLPDAIPHEEIPPEPPKPDLKKPDLETPPPLLTVGMLTSLLNPGANGTTISVDMGTSFMPDTGDIEIFLTGELDKQPRVLAAVKPLYPYDLQRTKTAGHAVVQFVIAPDGKVSRIRVTESTHRSFEQPAIEAVMKSKWQAGRKDGEDVHSLVKLEVKFNP